MRKLSPEEIAFGLIPGNSYSYTFKVGRISVPRTYTFMYYSFDSEVIWAMFDNPKHGPFNILVANFKYGTFIPSHKLKPQTAP
jgi:hypothetical protein